MFERVSRDARDTVERAQVEARALGHVVIGTEVLLLGVAAGSGRAAAVLAGHGATPDVLRTAIREAGGAPLDAEALASLGLDLEEIRRRAVAPCGPGALERGRARGTGRRRNPADDCRGHLRFTPLAKKSLELALREALAAGDRHIGAEHVLLGLLRDEHASAVRVLRRAGVEAAALREALRPAASRRGPGA